MKTFYKKYIKKAILPTLVITLIFFLNYYFFGMNNTMIGPFATLSFIRFRSISNHYKCMLKTYLIYVIMTVLAAVASLNLMTCIIINAAALFWIAYLLIDEYNPTNYFPAGMALIFFQIAPVWGKGLFIRLEALSASFAIIFAVIFLISLHQKNDPIRSYIAEGIIISNELIALCEENDHKNTSSIEELSQKLCKINKFISEEIYTYNRASIWLSGHINWYCQFVAVFQVINSICYFPDDSKSISDARELLEKYKAVFENESPKRDSKRLIFREQKFDIRSFRARFALRLVLVMTPCFALSYITKWENVYWLVISVFFMMIPITENTIARVRQRFIGTLLGIILCFILFYLFPTFPQRVVLMTIFNFLIYGAPNYSSMVAYITCSALAVTTIESAITIVLLQRFLYTIAGAVIALVANKLLFPIYTKKDSLYIKELLAKQRSIMKELSASNLPDEERRHQKDQALIKSYLLLQRQHTYEAMLPESEKDPDFMKYQRAHALSMAAFLTF